MHVVFFGGLLRPQYQMMTPAERTRCRQRVGPTPRLGVAVSLSMTSRSCGGRNYFPHDHVSLGRIETQRAAGPRRASLDCLPRLRPEFGSPTYSHISLITNQDDTDDWDWEWRIVPTARAKRGDAIAQLGIGPRIVGSGNNGLFASIALSYDADNLVNPLLTAPAAPGAGKP